ncbi:MULTISPECIES: carbon starvation protein CstA [Bacillus]|uniref:Carbon starvation-induced membrane protein n=1 Tax=Bacillus amyloliquefaciens (strain ATCC 23350 / DSM 7 / BCRC 11601 / CCUG 28519 / NBRC 15535 / NRRL B-14393 / F) TaxID=692420 RepID=A0A9P1JIT2_BACAS|nr:carbon starvation protein CstA [Bacillus amyloliquefaciens]AIW34679.1 carbon starvation protein CstA [Bacillus subtilis]AEB24982.1 carbon starvation protein CstA [Bacillus amyloliquefaciens TA208]AEB64491.1 carbon starvation-induced membrane protein [Bacillus amyloliquefaciens LL3]AEK90013.1 carbon starvation protein [Bacillus amyloliquefaciens XH7]AZV90143.1 carbon starvation protein CstA [Bacillus amyloliquefaciens]
MNAITIVIASICILAIAYRLYGTFMMVKVLKINDQTPTPAHVLEDGKDYVPTNKWVSFGHHFAAIAAAGPLVGPILAAQFGYLPGLLWLLIGAVIGGAVHDIVVLFASMRKNGKTLSEVAKEELGPVAGFCTGLSMLFIITITMAGLSMVVLHALEQNPWGTFAVGITIPIAMGVGVYYKKTGNLKLASTVGFLLLMAGVVIGPWLQTTALGDMLTLDAKTLAVALPVYAFFAAALPVWLLLAPRDYLSSFMKIGVFAALIAGVFFVNPAVQFPAVTEFIHGGGPVIAGPVWPFISITIACGAISGFHAFVGSGTTPKMLDKWSDIKPVAFGAMLVECLVGIMALIAAAALEPADYFAINSTPEIFRTLGMNVIHLPELSKGIGLSLEGRTGGAVTLAVGMTYIFTEIPFFSHLASYFFQFVIMFEAVFILTAIDAGTRVARYLIQEFFGEVYKPLKKTDWLPGSIFSSALACLLWGYLLYSGDISSIWALFGVSNQLMASVGLIIGATVVLKIADKRRYMLTCLIPLAYLYVTVNYAGYWMVRYVYLNPEAAGYNVLNGVLSIIMLILGLVIIIAAVKKWANVWRDPSARLEASIPG